MGRRGGAAAPRPGAGRSGAAAYEHRAAAAGAGRFRTDLLHRLAVVRVRVPPLRERKEDIPGLARRILDDLGPRAIGVGLSPETLAALAAYPWPGNVRELRNLVERAAALSAEKPVDPETLGLTPAPARGGSLDYRLAREQAVDAFERDFVVHLLRSCDKNVSRAAREAGIDRVYLHKLIKRHGIVVADL